MVAVDLAVSKETDSFHPHKQTRLYGITSALSQCPEGNSPVLYVVRGWVGPWGSEPTLWLPPMWPVVALITGQVRPSPFHQGSSLSSG